MAKKLKTYVIFVSRTFPAYHSKKGQPTNFVEKIIYAVLLSGLKKKLNATFVTEPHEIKLHTFRANYTLWKIRIDEVLAGNAVIVLKYHTIGRYVKGNKQIEFVRLDKDSGVGIQEVLFDKGKIYYPYLKTERKKKKKYLPIRLISQNDGLTYDNFSVWFEKGKYNLNESFACIHFTSFRYGTTLHS